MPRLSEYPLLVVLLGTLGLAAWLPAAHAVILGHYHVAQAFFYSGLVLGVLAVMLALATRQMRARIGVQGQLAALAGAYLLLPLAMALPLDLALPDTSFSNAWFEMLSCFTTTGASVYEPGRLPPSVHLWRAMSGWFGGFFILLAASAVLAPLNLGGAEVLSGRAPGRSGQGVMQIARLADPALRLSRHTATILPVYAGLTLALWIGLLIAGEDGLLALVHAMGTLSTSGITAGVGLSVTGSGLPGEILMFCFLIFAITRRAMPLQSPQIQAQALRRDPELRLAAGLVVVVVLVLLLRHLMSEVQTGDLSSLRSFLRAFWGAMFTSLSFLTTTGYESAYWSSARDWSGLGAPGLLLLALAILGGGVATTAGGVKLLRVYALFRHGQRELERIIHPNSIGGGGAAERRLRYEGAYQAWVFFMLFAISVALVMAALTVAGLAFETALVLGIAGLTTTGQLAGVASLDPILYSGLSDPVKLILGAAMILGRLETLALIALLAPGGWRR
ncbi:potassium transporter TrkG [Xinfangfangia pollutisoli]|uniref:potassium transporter TrkG n=1 Tax=Xinfangfangia pollutisoli TaxID=2865960 RepID=UPI001CD72A98|nr:potassium transporter TrkG [Xinfangfangia pollutisoli]